MRIPAYLFCGFLDAGKTSFIQKTLEDPEFNTGERTLLLLCEEGEVEFDTAKFPGGSVSIVCVESETDLTADFLKSLAKQHRAERIILEYNGMWQLQTLYDALPKNWDIFQIITVADGRTFPSYLANLRQQAVDQLRDPEVVLFNRIAPKTDKTVLHRAVRMVNRRASILFENTQGELDVDEIEDPLPFDKTAADITIRDEDYGVFYLDIMDHPEDYNGKTLRFKAYVCQTDRAPKGSFVAGRFAMTCCADDITYCGMVCEAAGAAALAHRSWVDVVATATVRTHAIYDGPGPWLCAVSAVPSDAPAEELVYFLR
ncbi:MAG: GTP-binding protein [Ruthenibacterium sp.]